MLQKRLCALGVLIFWASLATASQAIDAKYKAIGSATLGKAKGAEKSSSGGRVRLYANGGIYSSKASGTHAVYGPAFDKYKSLGAEKGKLGFPVTDVLPTTDGGTQTLFRRGYILGEKGGSVNAQVTPNATFTADSVTFSGGASAKMANDNHTAVVDGFLPESGAGGGEQTVTCSCTPLEMGMEIGMCGITPAGISKVRCQNGTCRKSCSITIIKPK